MSLPAPATKISSLVVPVRMLAFSSPNNTLKLNLNDLLHASTSTNILKVLGNSGDKVIVIGFNDSRLNLRLNLHPLI
jgi:hypothetical protein